MGRMLFLWIVGADGHEWSFCATVIPRAQLLSSSSWWSMAVERDRAVEYTRGRFPGRVTMDYDSFVAAAADNLMPSPNVTLISALGCWQQYPVSVSAFLFGCFVCLFICFETTSFCPAYHPFTNHRLNFVLLMVLPCSRYPYLCVVCAMQILWWRSQEPVLCVFC